MKYQAEIPFTGSAMIDIEIEDEDHIEVERVALQRFWHLLAGTKEDIDLDVDVVGVYVYEM